ncbi:Glutathione S-transferase-like protein ustS [Penicillium riverlandense]|uniref:Glutathione S-transferase-like protein ustS n=1 Tax=Penicillium riverlandense TaxID=1903569 RepID=UPI00254704C3|nr:Glutathione S-transferase-like protein ustS [Penicillium riverlandense]KAJ5820268.1 Glutathione S-transferase-like protein ustS [Penicillium riverlandense]
MADSEPVHFFDIFSDLPGASKSWSPNTLKTRMALNFKGIPYTQSWISYPDIVPLMKGLGVSPNEVGTPYTLPAIIHKSVKSNPNGAMMDSRPIAVHLDKTFPSRPLFPSGDASYALSVAVEKAIGGLRPAMMPLILPRVAEHMDPRGKEYFVRTRSEIFGKPLAEVRPTDQEGIQALWEILQNEFKFFVTLLKGREGKTGPFFEGDKPGYADMVLVCWIAFFHRFDLDAWEMIMSQGDGELKALWDACLPWMEGQGEDKDWPISQ